MPEDATIAEVDAHCHRLIARIRELRPSGPIIYRPKPSSPGRVAGADTEFAYKTRAGVHKKDVGYDLDRAHVVVSYSSAIAYEAHRMGVPSIVLGPGPARPIMSTSLDDLEHPRLALGRGAPAMDQQPRLVPVHACGVPQRPRLGDDEGDARMYTVVTSFSPLGWNKYARAFVNSFYALFPPD